MREFGFSSLKNLLFYIFNCFFSLPNNLFCVNKCKANSCIVKLAGAERVDMCGVGKGGVGNYEGSHQLLVNIC